MPHPASSTSAFAEMRANAGIGCCSSIFSAPLWRSPDTSRMPTNGSRAASDERAVSGRGGGAPRPSKLREGKKHVLEIPFAWFVRDCRQLVQRAFAAHAAAAQEDEPVAHSRRVVDLMDGQEHRPAGYGMRAQRLRHLARLAKIEAVERLVGEGKRVPRQQAGAKHPAP